MCANTCWYDEIGVSAVYQSSTLHKTAVSLQRIQQQKFTVCIPVYIGHTIAINVHTQLEGLERVRGHMLKYTVVLAVNNNNYSYDSYNPLILWYT